MGNKILNISIADNNNQEEITLKICDITGRTIVHKKLLNSSQIELNIPDGVYLVRMTSKNLNFDKKLIVN
jgi:hypothetical protein